MLRSDNLSSLCHNSIVACSPFFVTYDHLRDAFLKGWVLARGLNYPIASDLISPYLSMLACGNSEFAEIHSPSILPAYRRLTPYIEAESRELESSFSN